MQTVTFDRKKWRTRLAEKYALATVPCFPRFVARNTAMLSMWLRRRSFLLSFLSPLRLEC